MGKVVALSSNLLTLSQREHSTIYPPICGGPLRVQSRGGSRYFMTIIDDYSRKLLITILKGKDQAFTTFKEWKTRVENQI